MSVKAVEYFSGYPTVFFKTNTSGEELLYKCIDIYDGILLYEVSQNDLPLGFFEINTVDGFHRITGIKYGMERYE